MSNRNISSSCLALAASALAFAAPTAMAQDEEVREEIVVIGIAGSIQRSLEDKRESSEFVDVVASEDIGKLPDNNIAEALQRVPGVTIQRNRGEGDFVSIRGLGPDFVRGTVNGRTLVSATEGRDPTINGGLTSSTGRATNFDVLPSDIIDVLRVIKSPSAEHVEGGIGGVVDVSTVRPLDVGNFANFTLEASNREFRDETDPSASGLVSWVNDDSSFGVSAAISYSQRSLREDFSRTFAYITDANSFDTNLDGTGDVSSPVFTSSNNLDTYTEDRDRITFSGTLQNEFDNDSELLIDVLYSEREVSGNSSLVLISTTGLFSAAGGQPNFVGNGIVNPDNSLQAPDLVIQGGTAVQHSLTAGISTATDRQSSDDELLSVGVNYLVPLGSGKLDFDFSYSTAEGVFNFDRVSINSSNGVIAGAIFPFSVDLTGGLIQVAPTGPTAGFGDLNNFETGNSDAILRINEDDEVAFSVDFSRPVSGGFFSEVKAGTRIRSRDKTVNDSTSFFNDFPSNNGVIPATTIGGADAFYNVTDFLDGTSAFPFELINFPHIEPYRAAVNAASGGFYGDFTPVFTPSNSYDITEDTIAAYAQVDFDGEFGSLPVSGNFGIRIVYSQQDVTGFSQPFELVNDPVTGLGTIVFTSPDIEAFTIEDDYTNVLPSLNVKAELTEDVFLRASVNKSVTRPTFGQLAPALSINATQATASGGNPGLTAYESVNYDLGLEWYFAPASVVAGSIFTKDIDDFIAVTTNTDVPFSGATFTFFSQPDNQGEAEITGLELSYQQSFDSGFGFALNGTLVDSSAEFAEGPNTGSTIAFPGVSESSFNAVAYYENDSFQARLAYSERSDFVTRASDVFGNTVYVDDYEQLDFSASYNVSEMFTVFVNAINLTDETPLELSANLGVRPNSYSIFGRTISVGVRGGFDY